jgi:anti-sigma B factor antagonist
MVASGANKEILQVHASNAPDGRVVLRLTGELDLSTVNIFSGALEDLLDGDPVAIELDLSELLFLDSSGVGAYVTAHRAARANGSTLTIGARSAPVDRVLQLSGVETALEQETSESS